MVILNNKLEFNLLGKTTDFQRDKEWQSIFLFI
jgi:hypothetical protein